MKQEQQHIIKGQVIYVGPHIQHLGLNYGAIFKDGIYAHFYDVAKECPAFTELFVPVADYARVRRELNFDYAHNMRGTSGRFVTFYQAVLGWLTQKKKQKPKTPSGITLEHHHA